MVRVPLVHVQGEPDRVRLVPGGRAVMTAVMTAVTGRVASAGVMTAEMTAVMVAARLMSVVAVPAGGMTAVMTAVTGRVTSAGVVVAFRLARYEPRSGNPRTRPSAGAPPSAPVVPVRPARTSNRLESSGNPRSGSTRVRSVPQPSRPPNAPVGRVRRPSERRLPVGQANWPPMWRRESTRCSNLVEPPG